MPEREQRLRQDLLAEKHQTEDSRVELLFKLGTLLYSANEYEAAIAAYNKALEIKPDDQDAGYNWGIALDNLGRSLWKKRSHP